MQQIWHPWTEWEAYRAGLFDGRTELNPEAARAAYTAFLRDTQRFEAAILRVFKEWPVSCEHFLTNEKSNRVAWIGQAAMCIETGVSNVYRAGFKDLSPEEQKIANATAQKWLDLWIIEASL